MTDVSAAVLAKLGTTQRHVHDDSRPSSEPLRLILPDGHSIALSRALTVGRDAANDVVVTRDRTSRRHCDIQVLCGRVLVKDLGSTNGTFVNGLRVDMAELRHGYTLSVGGVAMRVVREAQLPSLGGRSPAMERLRLDIARVAPLPLATIILGETGTGKELVARALHELSGRTGPLVAVNCAAIPRELVESELFGHERGAFTGAVGKREGYFAQAHRGTLFLDEIGELPPELQAKLLRALETGRIRPVGGQREIEVDVRVVSATHVDLLHAVDSGAFRADLYFRLVQHTLHTPALRDRMEDVPQLADFFLRELPEPRPRLSAEALAVLVEHDWPGNVRELRTVVSRAGVLATGGFIHAADLRLPRREVTERTLDESADRLALDGLRYTDIEREVLARAIKRHGGNKRQAASELGIPKSTLCDKVKRYRIE
jgi:DNA-binding NtrC family response regulator